MNPASPWQRAGLQVAAWNAALMLLMWPVTEHLVGVWNQSDSYRFSWLVLPTMAYLALGPWRSRLAALSPAPS